MAIGDDATRRVALARPPSAWPALGRALIGRKPGLRGDATIPRIEASLSSAPAEPARIAAYREVCGFATSDVLPPCYPHILGAPLHLVLATHNDFPLPGFGLVHVRNVITEHHPIDAGADLAVACHVEGHRDVRQGWEFDVVTRVEADGRLAWDSLSSVLCRDRRGPRGPRPSGAPAPEAPRPRAPTRSDVWSLPGDLGRRYGKVSLDFNPIHMYGLTAKAFGFKRAIIHGMWSLARCAAELLDDMPPPPRTLSAEFKRPILLPSRILFESHRRDDGSLEFGLRHLSTNKPHVTGKLVAGAADAP